VEFSRGASPSIPAGWSVAELSTGWLTLIEQSPARILSRDATADLLRDGLWASANRPFSPEIRTDLGYPPDPTAALFTFGGSTQPGPAYFSAAENPRARILKREAPNVRDTASMLHLMRLNRWQSDAESQGRPYLAVAARFDLAPRSDPVRKPDGGIDAKAASTEDVLAMRSLAVVGPSTSDGGLPPFDWRTWSGAGFCGSSQAPIDPSCSPAGASGGFTEVASMCTVDRLPLSDADTVSGALPGAGGGGALAGGAPLLLPCLWDELREAWL
jgi:hypothetical protein